MTVIHLTVSIEVDNDNDSRDTDIAIQNLLGEMEDLAAKKGYDIYDTSTEEEE